MKVIREGRIKSKTILEPRIRFSCTNCDSVLEAEEEDMQYVETIGTGAVYKYTCPVCNSEGRVCRLIRRNK